MNHNYLQIKTWTPYLYALPALVVLGVFIYWPIIYSLYLSVHDWDFLTPAPRFVGLGSYEDLFDNDRFADSIAITAWFTLFTVPVRLLIALALAHFLTAETRRVEVLRVIFFTPYIASSVAVAIAWSWLYNTDIGLINQTIELFGFAGLPWLTSTDSALSAVIIVNIWKQLGFDLVIYIAGLQAIPPSVYEAARMDGARPWAQFRDVTVPMVMPTTFFLLVISVIDSFQVFTIVRVMTGGGPALSTDVIINLLYQLSFIQFEIGQAAALAVLLFAFLIGLTALQFLVVGRKVNYDFS